MKLSKVTFEGYRRFLNKTTLKMNSKLTVLIGPNEAGKSSVLKMLSGSSEGGKFAIHERYKFRDNVKISIEAEYHLNEEDHDAIGSSIPKRYVLRKSDEGKLFHHFIPEINRDKTHRLKFKDQLIRCIDSKLFKEFCEIKCIEYDQLRNKAADLSIDAANIPPENLEFLDEVAASCGNISTSNLKVPNYISYFPITIEKFKDTELKPDPNSVALEKVETILPKIVEFREKDRELNTTFNMNLFEHPTPAQRQEPCAALVNLCSISGLDLHELKVNLTGNKPDRITKQFDNANLKLKRIFDDAWSQSDISIYLGWNKPSIEIMVQIRGDEGLEYNLIEDRSDGFRQYVALLAFIIKEDAQKPILLIDEAELHLHYDAQADLIQTFTERNLTSQVIYTTHSAGCLPEDLGVGVKLVVPEDTGADFATSHIENNFWASDTLGFSPILYGMGAKTLAFFPIRKAVVTEGQTEMLLMPTIFRQVSGKEFNGFQIVPGLAGASNDELGQFALQGQKVAYLLDNDGAGKDYFKALEKAGVSTDAIFYVNAASRSIETVEDWISDDVFAEATERYRLRFFSDKPAFGDGYFNGDKKAEKLKKYDKENDAGISKIDLAYFILDIASEDLTRGIFNPKHKNCILELRSNLISLLE